MVTDQSRIFTDPVKVREEIKAIVRSAAEPWEPGDFVATAITRAASRLGLPAARAKEFWYGRAHAWAWECDQIRAWRLRHEASEEQRLRSKLHALQARLGIENAASGEPSSAGAVFVERRRPGNRIGDNQAMGRRDDYGRCSVAGGAR